MGLASNVIAGYAFHSYSCDCNNRNNTVCRLNKLSARYAVAGGCATNGDNITNLAVGNNVTRCRDVYCGSNNNSYTATNIGLRNNAMDRYSVSRGASINRRDNSSGAKTTIHVLNNALARSHVAFGRNAEDSGCCIANNVCLCKTNAIHTYLVCNGASTDPGAKNINNVHVHNGTSTLIRRYAVTHGCGARYDSGSNIIVRGNAVEGYVV